MRKPLIDSFIIILTFLLAYYGRKLLHQFIPISFSGSFLKYSYFYAWWVLPTLLATGYLYGFSEILRALGLDSGIKKGSIFSLVAVSPMFLSSAFLGRIHEDLDYGALFQTSFGSGFFEEYFFRGFLFGLLFRKAKWGFIPASILGALISSITKIYSGFSLRFFI